MLIERGRDGAMEVSGIETLTLDGQVGGGFERGRM